MIVRKSCCKSSARKTSKHRSNCCSALRPVASALRRLPYPIKQLHLIKEPTGFGTYRYAVSTHRTRLNFAEKLRNIFRECVLSVDYAQNLVVIKTMAGLAGAAASALDGMENDELIGCVAGDDTVLVVLRDTESAADFCMQMREQLL